jgi:hypothetical protein
MSTLHKPLSSFLSQADKLMEELINNQTMKIDHIRDVILMAQKEIKTLQSVAMRLVEVSNMYNKVLLSRTKKTSYLDPMPDNISILFQEEDAQVEGTAFQIGAKKIRQSDETKYADEFVPRSDLFFGGGIFKMNISNFLVSGGLLDIVEAGRKIEDKDREVRSGSWVYNPEKAKKSLCRRVGGRMTIEYDIHKLGVNEMKEELELRKKQLMHDILVCLILERERIRLLFE